MTATVVIADDHPVVLAGLESMLGNTDEFRIVARCVNGQEALNAVRHQRPDILVADLNMPRVSGLEVLRSMHAEQLSTRVVLLVAEITQRQALDAIKAGVGGILLKELAPQMLIRCLQKVHSGEQWFEKQTFGGVIERLVAREAGLRSASAVLTPREIEVARLVAAGLRNRAIAEQLNVTEGTVKLHLHNMYSKLSIQSRVELMLYATRTGLADT